MPVEVPVPTSGPKPQICIWSDFSIAHLDELKLLENVEEIKGKFSEILGFDGNGDETRSQIMTDLFYFAYVFAIENKFNEEQISAFLSIIRKTHEKSIESPYGNIDASYGYFKELLLKHCVKRPPFSMQLYNIAEVKKISDYVLETYFRHYKLYKYAFTQKVCLDLTFEYNGLPEEPEETTGDKGENEDESCLNNEGEDNNDGNGPQPVQEEDPVAVKELKAMINSTLTDQVHKLKVNVDQQLKANEEKILKKFSQATGVERGPSRKSKKK